MSRFKILCALLAAICWLCVNAAKAGNPVPIVQGFAGISQGNGTLPCANPGGANGCYGIPDGSVAVMPNQIMSENAPGVYYAVFETGSWSGTLNVTFQITEAGTVIQKVTASGPINANSVALVSVPESFPSNNGYQGLATMSVTTNALPSGGGTPLTLKSGTEIQVRQANQPITKVLAFTGVGGAWCFNPDSVGSCYGVPNGALVMQPENLVTTNVPEVYAVFQTGYWVGGFNCTWQISEAGTVVGTVSTNVGARNNTIVLPNSGIDLPGNGYIGPAVLAVTCTATAAHGPPTTLTAGALLGIQ